MRQGLLARVRGNTKSNECPGGQIGSRRRERPGTRGRPAGPALAFAALALSAAALVGGGGAPEPRALLEPWPRTSRHPVSPLQRPEPEERARALGLDPGRGFRFAAFGDQRALADGEWQVLMDRLDEAARRESLLFVVDTGDVVEDGRHADQFRVLEAILDRAESLPYLLAAGNHETSNNDAPRARAHLARFAAPLDSGLAPERLWYRRDVGPLRLLFLDTNDWVYGESGERDAPEPEVSGERSVRQWSWLEAELARAREDRVPLLAVVMHHPFLQSSEKHRDQSRGLWSLSHRGRRLPDLFAEGGVDLVLSGHTHTYERFSVTRDDGRSFLLVNLSGRPRPSFLWFGSRARRAIDIEGRENEWLAERGWRDLERWTIRQEEAMQEPERNQFAVLTVEADGGLLLDVRFTGRSAADGVRSRGPVRLR